MRRVRFLLGGAVLAAFLALTGCGSGQSTVGYTGPSGSPGPSGDAAFRARAQHVAATWAGSGAERAWRTRYIPLADTVVLPSDAFHSDSDKEAFNTGSIQVQAHQPQFFAPATVRWADGSSLSLPRLDPASALLRGQAPVPCGSGCLHPLVVTAVTPTTMRLPTSRGLATVPAWSLQVRGYARPFTAAAVPGSPVPGKDTDRRFYPELDGADGLLLVSVSADGRTLTVEVDFGTCFSSERLVTGAFHYEAKASVVVEGWHREPVQNGPCAGVGSMVDVRVHLDTPLGSRVVLDPYGAPLHLAHRPAGQTIPTAPPY